MQQESNDKHSQILVIDDDRKLGELLVDYLSQFQLSVIYCDDPITGFARFREGGIDVIVLDIMMPKLSGLDLCRKIRAEATTPIILLTARGDLADRVVGLELGADDYLAKPFEPRELVARVQALLRRSSGGIGNVTPADLNVDLRNGRAFRIAAEGKKVDLNLTDTEFVVLNELIKHRPEPVARTALYTKLRGFERDISDRSIDILVSRLRTKLGDNRTEPKYIRTVRLIGYAFIA